jgi:hypothetical protein
MSESNKAVESNVVAEADNCTIHPGLTLVPIVDIEEIASQESSPVTNEHPESCPGTPQHQVASLSNAIYLRLNHIWANFVAQFRVLVELVFLWPRILFELPRLVVSIVVLVVTVSWLSLSRAFNVFGELLKTVVAWIILACYLCAFSLQATWITLRNVAVARRGQLTIREVLDSISGNRTLEASS